MMLEADFVKYVKLLRKIINSRIMFRFMLKYSIEIIPFVLFRPSTIATGLYEDKRISFRYEIIQLCEKQATDFIDENTLYPFIPLMEGVECNRRSG